MSKTVLILFAACVGLSLLSLHLVQRMRDGQSTIAELQAQVAKLESERQQPPSPVFTVEPALPPPVEQVAPEPAPAKETPKVAAAKTPALPQGMFAGGGPPVEDRMRYIREARERQRLLMQDPEYREAMRLQQRNNLGRQYPGLVQELGLTGDQAEQLLDLLADQQMRNNDQAELVWDSENLDPAAMQERQQKMQQRWTEIQQKNEAELAAQLGPDKLQAWKEYQSTLGARHQTEQLRSTLAGQGVALNEEASRAVVKAYAESQKIEMQEYSNMARANAASSGRAGLVGVQGYSFGPSSEMYARQLEHTKKRNQRVLDAVSPFLTYEQREALQKQQDAELKMQEAQIRVMRAQSNGDPSNAGGWVSNSVQAIIVPDQ